MNEKLADLEAILVKEFRPTFLSLQYEEDEKKPFIHVVISSRQFNELSIDQRVATVYKKVFDSQPDLLSMLPVIVETFTSSEMVEIFEYIK